MKFYYIKKRRKPAPLLSVQKEAPAEGDGIIAFRDEAAIEESLTASVLRAVGWLARSLGLLFLVTACIMGGIIAQKSAALVKDDLWQRASAAQVGLEDGLKSLEAGKLDDALVNFKLAQANLAYATDVIYGLGQGGVLVADLPYYQSGVPAKGQFLAAVLDITGGGVRALEAVKGLQTLFDGGGLLLSEEIDRSKVLTDFKGLQEGMAAASASVKRGKGRLDRLSSSNDPELRGYLSAIQPKLTLAVSALDMGDRLAQGLPDVLGFNRPRSYLLMFQNNNELRPTGGFFGSYGILDIKNGQIEELKVDDTYCIDGQLVSPGSPEKIFPNANFDPDFLVSSQKVRELYEQAGGGTVDGVIALTPRLLEDFLGLTGSVYLSERRLNLTASNVVEILQREIEIAANESERPKAILAEVAPILLYRFKNATSDIKEKLAQLFLAYLQEKDLLVALDNQKVASVLSELHFDGSLKVVPPSSDYLLVNRANIGARKSSQHLESHLYYLATINLNGEVSVSLTMAFHHQGSNIFPDGTNIDYIRVYLPAGSQLTSLVGSNSDSEVERKAVGNYAVIGFYLTTSPGENKEVILNYQLPFKVDFQKDQAYFSLYLEKQPGLENTHLEARVQVPSDWISYAQDPFGREGGTLTLFNGAFQEDVSRSIVLEK